MKKVLAIALSAAMILSLAACGKKEAPPATEAATTAAATQAAATQAAATQAAPAEVPNFKVGSVLPMTGNSARNGELQFEGFKLYADYVNENGGIKSLGGAKIELVQGDSNANAEMGATEAERLITKEKVNALVGPYNSGVGAAMIPIAEKYGVPFCISNCTADEMLENEALVYSFRPNHCNSTVVAAVINGLELLKEKDPATPLETFALVYENTDWGISCISTYVAAMEAKGYKMTIQEAFEAGSADFSTVINKIKSGNVDFVMPVMQISDGQLFLRQLNEYKVNKLLFWAGGGILADDFIEAVTPEVANYQITLNGWCLDSMADSFNPDLANAMNEKCKADCGCEMNECVANGWIAIATLVDAVERAGSTEPDAIAKALAETKIGRDNLAMLFHPYEGVSFEKPLDTWNASAKMYHQNIYGTGILTQIIDSQYRQVWPDWSNNPLVYPIPAKN